MLLPLLKRESPNTRIYSQYPRGRPAIEETCNMQGESYVRLITCISYSPLEGAKVMARFLNSNSKGKFQMEEFYVTKCKTQFMTS